MTGLILIAAMILSFGKVQADELTSRVTSTYNSYQSHLRAQEMHVNSIQNLINEIDSKQRSLRTTTAYTVRSGQLNLEINTLVNRLQQQISTFSSGSARVTINAQANDDALNARRNQYHQQLRNLSAMDANSLRNLKLPVEIRDGVELMRNIKDLPADQQNQRMRLYEGRTFGEPISRPEQLRGLSQSGEVKLTSGETNRTVSVRVGQTLTIQTPSGGVVRGSVAGVLPSGQVVIQNVWPSELARLTNLASQPGRIVDLNAASTVIVNSNAQSQPNQYNVRFSTAHITDAIRTGKLSATALRGRASGGPTGSIVETVFDKTTGRQMGVMR
jgi:hypothetical protein